MPETVLYTDVDYIIEEITQLLDSHPDQEILVNAGEDSDALALDHLTSLSEELVPIFAQRESAVLELRTKSANIDNLLRINSSGRTIVAFSMSPGSVAARFEHGASTLAERLEAARKCQDAGYRIAFKFEPIICVPKWEDVYQEMVSRICRAVDTNFIDHISLGALRFSGQLKQAISALYPQTSLLDAKFEESTPGQFTYPFELRRVMYRRILASFRAYAPSVPYYLSVESKAMLRDFGDPTFSFT